MELTRNQFDILTFLEKNDEQTFTQRELAKELNLSLGTINNNLTSLQDLRFLKDGKLTEKGFEALEPYRVKRAIFIAAGYGSRLVPITLNTPKPLVRVHGKRIIDGLLDAVIAAGIEDIVIVRGYLSEQFDQLLYKYPNLKFVENPIYNEANNISSAICVRYLFQNAYVLEGDLLISNPNLITKYQYTSNYLGIKVDKTDDWCFKTSSKGYVNEMAIGGINCYQMVGISYWNKRDGAKLSEDLNTVYLMPGGKERFWDQVPLEYCLNNYQVEVRECLAKDIIEIDTYTELKAIDPTYK